MKMDWLRDKWVLLRTFYRASWLVTVKSPTNLWLSNILRVVYYAAMFLFWYGVRSTRAGAEFMSRGEVYGFLITVGVVENLVLCFIGRGSLDLAARVSRQTLEPVLALPRGTLACFVLLRPNPIYFPILGLFVVAQVFYYAYGDFSPRFVVAHVVTVLCGALVLSGITFIYRLTSFWTDSIVRVKHSNPSFKILIRPASAFQGKLRFILLTLFPALFITGIPYELLMGERSLVWILLCTLAMTVVWGYVLLLWRFGVQRYGKRVI